MVRPQRVAPESGPNERAQAVPATMAMAVVRMVAAERRIWHSSVKNAIEISLIDMVDVSDATSSRRKKSVAHTLPHARWEKMAGNTSNTRRGPDSGDAPKVNTAGKITIPAITATSVSSPAIVEALRSRRVSGRK